jgi:hypothetical protein
VREKELEQEKERARIKEVDDALLATVWVDLLNRCIYNVCMFGFKRGVMDWLNTALKRINLRDIETRKTLEKGVCKR